MASTQQSDGLLLLVAGVKGTVGSTLAAAVAALPQAPEQIMPYLTTAAMFDYLGPLQKTRLAGWDTSPETLAAAIRRHGIVPEHLWRPHAVELERIPVQRAQSPTGDLNERVQQLIQDIRHFRSQQPASRPVFINLLPAGAGPDLGAGRDLDQLYAAAGSNGLPDLAYTLAAVLSGVPVVNFTPNIVEIPAVMAAAVRQGVPVAGRDGKTGQTYLKVVLASALRARNLLVDGWYSLNILGNADGKNLMDPVRAEGKLRHKTELLDDILGYRVGERYGAYTHKVRIDYYPPRGDAKEAWDAIDFRGLFGLPMSIRLNLLGRDSILAAPLALDLARWVSALQLAGRVGAVPELAFYFKKAVGNSAPVTLQDQLAGLSALQQQCDARIASQGEKS